MEKRALQTIRLREFAKPTVQASRTTDSLQQQVTRLEQECAQCRELLNLAEQNQKRAEALLEARTEEKTAEVEDMNSQIQWFRNEYDSLLKKVCIQLWNYCANFFENLREITLCTFYLW